MGNALSFKISSQESTPDHAKHYDDSDSVFADGLKEPVSGSYASIDL